ncbi:hypothetical protein LDENG_00116670 [Lucifuga dentata]|nr:hypothetical protein LDENG_00116670 [Lucifuga dentata]
MQKNFLKLSCDKSEIVIIGPKSLIKKPTHSFSLTKDKSTVLPHTTSTTLESSSTICHLKIMLTA